LKINAIYQIFIRTTYSANKNNDKKHTFYSKPAVIAKSNRIGFGDKIVLIPIIVLKENKQSTSSTNDQAKLG
jgi:hypothetical protein